MEHVQLEHDHLRVVVDATTGALREVVHVPAGLALVASPDIAARHPFMIVMDDGTTRRTWLTCTVEHDRDARAARVSWTMADGLRLEARVRQDAASGEVRCTVRLHNPARLPVAAVAYPYIAGIGRLGDSPAHDELVHPYATGFLVRNPLDHLPPVTSETAGQEPVVLGLYPEGFSGSAMSFMAYSAAGRGGFYVAAEDAAGREKWLNFYRHGEGDLRMTVWHGPADDAERQTLAPGYETVLAPLDGGSWYDAADRYKAWALAQPWAARGPLWSRDDRPRRLLEDVGLCAFGINARHDRVPWIAEIDRIAGTPVLHVLGPNWPRTGADYMNNLPGGLDDWFPAQFNAGNLEAMRRNGDMVTPFEFDLLFGRGEDRADAAAGRQALQLFPTPLLSHDAYHFPFLCPVSPFTRELHVARDRMLVEQVGVDGVYYDISVNNVRHICLSTAHGHQAGATVALTAAYRGLFAETAGAMRAAGDGDAPLQGTEMINEQMLPVISFYQARAEASPASPFEAKPFRALIKQGVADKIPLFAYVYHAYGPLRLDGWAKLSREQGDYIYFVLGRVFLQGGLIELNDEFSPLEDLGDARDSVADHYWRFDHHHYAIDPDLARFVGRLARARVGRANRYLAYGTMLRPAPLAVDDDQNLRLEYFLYNCDRSFDEYEDRGALAAPTVLQVAWHDHEGNAAWLLLNLATDGRMAHLELDPAMLPPTASSAWTLTLYQEDEPIVDLGTLDGRRTVTLTLPSRRPVMLEAVPVAAR